MSEYRNPVPTVDVIIVMSEHTSKGDEKILLIKRKNPPLGWALPGGFVDYGETVEMAAAREAFEETGLKITKLKQFHTYSDPSRDTRMHTISCVFTAQSNGTPHAGDDAVDTLICDYKSLPGNIVFDHREIISDYYTKRYEV